MSSRKYRVLWGAAFALTGFVGGQNQAYGGGEQGAAPVDDKGIDTGAAAEVGGEMEQGAGQFDIGEVDTGTEVGGEMEQGAGQVDIGEVDTTEVGGEMEQGAAQVDITGINVVSAHGMGSGTDVTHVEYEVSRVSCGKEELFAPLRLRVTEEINAMRLPGGVPAFEDMPLDADSEHSFADHFEALPPGCYDVRATPLSADGFASLDCEGASQNDVLVEEGRTTEIFLMGQCSGVSVGAIDTVLALNQPPSLLTLGFTPSKFIKSCQKTTVCATAVDPDNDPIELVWREVGSNSLRVKVVFQQRTGNEMTECVEIRPTAVGDRLIEVRAFDMVHDPDLGLVRVEQLLRDQGSLSTSHASLQFPVYVGL